MILSSHKRVPLYVRWWVLSGAKQKQIIKYVYALYSKLSKVLLWLIWMSVRPAHKSSSNSRLISFAAFSLARGSGSSNGGHGVSRLKSQLSFTRQDSLSQISGLSENMVDRVGQENGHPSGSHSYATTSFGLDSWENSHSIVFSAPSGKRAKTIDGDIYSFHPLDSQVS